MSDKSEARKEFLKQLKVFLDKNYSLSISKSLLLLKQSSEKNLSIDENFSNVWDRDIIATLKHLNGSDELQISKEEAKKKSFDFGNLAFWEDRQRNWRACDHYTTFYRKLPKKLQPIAKRAWENGWDAGEKSIGV